MPPPLDNPAWRYNNLIFPMEKVGEEGTAKRLQGLVKKPYKIIYKTGTIEEADPDLESEMLFFLIGKFDDVKKEFVPGLSLSCFFYMEESKLEKKDMKKFNFAEPIIKKLLEYLQEKIKKKEI